MVVLYPPVAPVRWAAGLPEGRHGEGDGLVARPVEGRHRQLQVHALQPAIQGLHLEPQVHLLVRLLRVDSAGQGGSPAPLSLPPSSLAQAPVVSGGREPLLYRATEPADTE